MAMLKRLWSHLTWPRWRLQRLLSATDLDRIEAAVRAAEAAHDGQIRVIIESHLHWDDILRGLTSRARALQLFSLEKIWDTEHNSGVLIYLLWADRAVEIIADRGVHRAHGETALAAIAQAAVSGLRAGYYGGALATAIEQVAHQMPPRNGSFVGASQPDRPTLL